MRYTEKYIKTILVAIILISAFPVHAQFTIPTQDNGTTANGTPASQDNGTTASTIPISQDNGTTAANPAPAPTVQNNETTAGSQTNNIAVQDNGTTASSNANNITVQDNGTTASAGQNNTAVQNNNTSTGGAATVSTGGGGGGGGTSFTVATTATSTTATTTPALASTTCAFLSSNLKTGINNPVDQMNRLQSFLKNTEKLDVNITGFFDQKTLNAVKVFQVKYTADILDPWNIKVPTGNVYYTTRKKINEISCKTSVSLTPVQLAEISAYKVASKNPVAPKVAQTSTIAPVKTPAPQTEGIEVQTASVVANVGDSVDDIEIPSFSSRLWDFTKSIFGRKAKN